MLIKIPYLNVKLTTFHLAICIIFISIFLIISYITYGFFRLGDDTYIYLQYARSIIERGEITFNPGEPSYGFTSPLWLFLLSLVIKITGSYLQAPHILTLTFSTLSIVVWFIIVNNTSLKSATRYLFLFIIILDPNLLKHSYLGMEASASFFLSSVLIFTLLTIDFRYIWIFLSILFGFFFLIRPESIIIYIILIFVLLAFQKINTKKFFLMLMISLFIVLPWIIFSFIYFGNIIPTTFIAKGAGYTLGTRFFNHLIDSLKIFGGNYLLLTVAIFLIIYYLWTKRISNYKSIIFIGIISSIGLITFYSLTLNKEIVYARYYCMAFPFIYLFLIILLTETHIESKYINFYLGLVILYSVIITLVFSNLTKEMYEDEIVEDQIALWVKQNTDPSAIIVRSRIGKIGFLSERKILDPMGIINLDIIKFNKNDNSVEFYAIYKPGYFIGTFDVHELEKYAKVELIKEFVGAKYLLPRHMFLGNEQFVIIPIYEVNWY